jgi:hypothetical protein
MNRNVFMQKMEAKKIREDVILAYTSSMLSTLRRRRKCLLSAEVVERKSRENWVLLRLKVAQLTVLSVWNW